ncbi:hypothetical protein BBA71_10725 [Acetobacter pasteurianus]|nr:hypothetical protein BBA71_10725 [Acetobacter pasteurianus]
MSAAKLPDFSVFWNEILRHHLLQKIFALYVIIFILKDFMQKPLPLLIPNKIGKETSTTQTPTTMIAYLLINFIKWIMVISVF